MAVKKSLPSPSTDSKGKRACSSSLVKDAGKVKKNKGPSLLLDLTFHFSDAPIMEAKIGVGAPAT